MTKDEQIKALEAIMREDQRAVIESNREEHLK